MEKLLKTDMHIHTTASDGEYTPEQIYKKIKQTNQITTFAITAHDTVSAAKRLKKYLKENPDPTITYIPGIEITTNIQNPKYKITKSKLHILGYGFELSDPQINQIIKKRRQINKKLLEAQIESLEEKFQITFPKRQINSILEKSHFNRVDLALALIKNGQVQTLEEAFKKYLDPSKRKITPMPIYEEEVFTAIKNAGGYVTLAHPTSLRLKIEELNEYIKYLKTIGLDAIEVYHPQQKRAYSRKLKQIANNQHLQISAGSDYHGPIVKPNTHIGINQTKKPKTLTLKIQK